MEQVAVFDTGYDSYQYEMDHLKTHGYELLLFTGPDDDIAGKIAFAQEAVGIFVRRTCVNGEILDQLPELRVIVRYGVGYDNIDLDAASDRGIRVANVQGYADHAVSDHALALIYASLRALNLRRTQMHSNYAQPPIPDLFELHDKTLGIVGLGHIGGTLCRKAQTLFDRVLAVDPYVSEDRFATLGAIKTDLRTLCGESHIISLHCNLSAETRHLIDGQAFANMTLKPYLINTSRGEVVDESALRKALRSGQIAAAGLDVYVEEPPGEDMQEVLNHPRVVATGHYAWYSDASQRNLQRGAAHNMVGLLQGLKITDLLNPPAFT